MLVKWWDIPFWRMFDNLRNAIGANDGIMYYMRAPSVAVLYTVPKDGITCHILAHEDTIMDKERVMEVGDS